MCENSVSHVTNTPHILCIQVAADEPGRLTYWHSEIYKSEFAQYLQNRILREFWEHNQNAAVYD